MSSTTPTSLLSSLVRSIWSTLFQSSEAAVSSVLIRSSQLTNKLPNGTNPSASTNRPALKSRSPTWSPLNLLWTSSSDGNNQMEKSNVLPAEDEGAVVSMEPATTSQPSPSLSPPYDHKVETSSFPSPSNKDDGDRKPQRPSPTPSVIKQLMNNPHLFTPYFEPPRNPIVLCHGLYGFDVRGPPESRSSRHYWANILETLRGTCGAEVIITSVPPTGSIKDRAEKLNKILEEKAKGREINFLAHSMGGLDARHLITHLKPQNYKPISLTTVATPHRGSPFMDWCSANIGLGAAAHLAAAEAEMLLQSNKTAPKLIPAYSLSSPLLSLPAKKAFKATQNAQAASLKSSSSASSSSASSHNSTSSASASASSSASSSSSSSTSQITSFLPSIPFSALGTSLTSYILQQIDSPAYSNLTTDYLNNYFNPSTPDHPDVKYFSTAARANTISILHPLWLPKLILDSTAQAGQCEVGGFAGEMYEGNDAMVSVSSAKWGEFLGIVDDCNHWDIRGEPGKLTPGALEEDLLPSVSVRSSKPPPPKNKDIPSDWTWEDLNTRMNARLLAARGGAAKDENSAISSVVGWLSDIIPGVGGKEDGKVDQKARERREGVKEKFELGKFYGGLLLKMQKEGL